MKEVIFVLTLLFPKETINPEFPFYNPYSVEFSSSRDCVQAERLLGMWLDKSRIFEITCSRKFDGFLISKTENVEQDRELKD